MTNPPPPLHYRSPSRVISKDRANAVRALRGLGTVCFVFSGLGLLASPCLVLFGIPFGTGITFCLLIIGGMIFIPFCLGCVYRDCATEIEKFSRTALRTALIITIINLVASILFLVIGITGVIRLSPGLSMPAAFIVVFVYVIRQLAKVRREAI
jgi:uncharacterized membrane protein